MTKTKEELIALIKKELHRLDDAEADEILPEAMIAKIDKEAESKYTPPSPSLNTLHDSGLVFHLGSSSNEVYEEDGDFYFDLDYEDLTKETLKELLEELKKVEN